MFAKLFAVPLDQLLFGGSCLATIVFFVLVVIQKLREVWENDQILPRAVTGEFHAPKKFFDFWPLLIASFVLAIICGIASL